MAKRKLSKQQIHRIRRRQSQRLATRNAGAELDGPVLSGLVTSHHGTQVEVEPDTPEQPRLRCHLRANLEAVTTGDRVRYQIDGEQGVVSALEPRKTLISRPDKYGKLKPVAANVEQIIITIAPEPEPHFNLIDRYIAVSENLSIKPLIVINKADLLSGDDHQAADTINAIESLYSQLGYECLRVCAHQLEASHALVQALKGQINVFVGQSGVGKSSLIQALLPHETLRIGALSEAATKGTHTTTHSCLYHFPSGGACIDSPGIREFGLWHMTAEEVLRGFTDISEWAGQCRFRDCSHSHEPGCAVQQALESGELSPIRFDSYQRILQSLDDVQLQSR